MDDPIIAKDCHCIALLIGTDHMTVGKDKIPGPASAAGNMLRDMKFISSAHKAAYMVKAPVGKPYMLIITAYGGRGIEVFPVPR